MIKHGDIWLANLNPGRGTEPGKTRPVLILQHQDLIEVGHPSTVIIPLTTQLVEGKAEPLRLRIKAKGKLKKDSELLIDQIRSIDNIRLKEGPLLHCSAAFMRKVYAAVQLVLGVETTG